MSLTSGRQETQRWHPTHWEKYVRNQNHSKQRQPMHQPHPHLTPTGYTNLYQHCINAGWTEDQLDQRLTEVELRAQSAGYIAATLKGLVHDGPPVAAAASNRTAAATGPHTIRTATIAGQPGAGRRIHPHPYQGDEHDCHQCQLPRANTVHQTN